MTIAVMTIAGRGALRGRLGWRTSALIVLCLSAAAGITGCSVEVGSGDEAGAGCQSDGPLNSPSLVLVAQAVPTASLLPCIQSIPRGWNEKLTVANGRAEYAFSSHQDGERAFRVLLTRTCDISGASRVPSEVTGTRRYELPTRVTDGYAGRRFYVFSGGCVTYRFGLHGASRAQAVTEATSTVGWVSRQAVREMVDRHGDGRLRLDTSPSGRP